MQQPIRLIVLADDWARHPSSCQYLIGRLLDRYPTIWVNTIGMRGPDWSMQDLKRIAQRVRQWLPVSLADGQPPASANLTVVTPRMWPSFRHAWERRLNARLITRAVRRSLLSSHGTNSERRLVVTTLPITSVLAGHLQPDAWVYYCVDDFSVWPGLEGRIMQELESRLLEFANCVVTASAVLQDRLLARGVRSTLLTHGVDIAHWRPQEASTGGRSTALPGWWRHLKRPIALFWGLVDQRLDIAWLRQLQNPSNGAGGSLVLLGPTQNHDPAIGFLDRVVVPGAVPYASLPLFAADADVLVMPYADLPVTRAMQPLKLKEYLSTDKPAVLRSLPATREWADAADVVDTAGDFVRAVGQRAGQRAPSHQLAARTRLVGDSWESRAAVFEQLLLACATPTAATAGTCRCPRDP